MVGQFENSEKALNEANKFDPEIVEVWVFLTLVNLKKKNIVKAN